MQNAKFLFILLICRLAFAPSFVRKPACRDLASRGNNFSDNNLVVKNLIKFLLYVRGGVALATEESVMLKIQNFEPTLRSECRECKHSMPSREEETRVYLS